MQETLLKFYKPEILEEIRKAAVNQNIIVISYEDSKGSPSEREGEPYEIKNDGLYMYCYLKGSIRFFKLSNIKRVVNTRKKFTPKWPIKIT